MPSVRNILISFLAGTIAVNASPTAVPTEDTAIVEVERRADSGNTPFLNCCYSITGWPKVSKDAIKKCASANHKRDPASDLETRYTPGDYTECIRNLPTSYTALEVLKCEQLLPSPVQPRGNNLTARGAEGPFLDFKEYAEAVCAGSSAINWGRFVTAQTVSGYADFLCNAACGAPVSFDKSGLKTTSLTYDIHGLRQLGITYAIGPQVTTVLTILDLGFNIMGAGGMGVAGCASICKNAIQTGLDVCVDHARAGLETADATMSFSTYVAATASDIVDNGLAFFDLSFPKGN